MCQSTRIILNASLLLLLVGQHRAVGSSSTNFKNYLVLLYKGSYVGYGNGRYSERDLPECGGGDTALEACNLTHRRYWLPPLVERLCRCPGHTACPLHSGARTNATDGGGGERVLEEGSDEDESGEARQQLLEQHINNRAHLQFCNVGLTSSGLEACSSGAAGLTVQLVEHTHPATASHSPGQVVLDSHTALHCRCQPPRYWKLLNTSHEAITRDGGADTHHQQYRRHNLNRVTSARTHYYECQQLPTCTTYELCSEVRPDTHESYYTCSCPPGHLCLVPWGARKMGLTPHTLPHYTGSTQRGVCTPHIAERRHRARG